MNLMLCYTVVPIVQVEHLLLLTIHRIFMCSPSSNVIQLINILLPAPHSHTEYSNTNDAHVSLAHVSQPQVVFATPGPAKSTSYTTKDNLLISSASSTSPINRDLRVPNQPHIISHSPPRLHLFQTPQTFLFFAISTLSLQPIFFSPFFFPLLPNQSSSSSPAP
jgi:hypothetical protein